jgi:2-iminobutanoate/2-iminopropanoate deaminase
MRRRHTVAWVVVLALLFTGCTLEDRADRNGAETAEATAPRKQVIQPEGAPRLPVFSSAIRSGDFIFLSGSIGALPGVTPPTLIEGGIQPEARLAMENLHTILEAAGADWEDVVKCTVFLADMAEYGLFNEVYQEFFPEDPPARSALAAGGLVFDARVEVECIAAAPEGS